MKTKSCRLTIFRECFIFVRKEQHIHTHLNHLKIKKTIRMSAFRTLISLNFYSDQLLRSKKVQQIIN